MCDITSPTNKKNNDCMSFLNAQKNGYVVTKKQLIHSNLDEYQSDVILNMPERFFPMLSQEDISTLVTPFCVDDMYNTGCFSSHKRSLRVIKKYRDEFNLEEGYTFYDINDAFKDKKMTIVRRALDENGVKKDDEYTMVEATFITIQPMFADEYYGTNILFQFEDKQEPISLDRAFFRINV